MYFINFCSRLQGIQPPLSVKLEADPADAEVRSSEVAGDRPGVVLDGCCTQGLDDLTGFYWDFIVGLIIRL